MPFARENKLPPSWGRVPQAAFSPTHRLRSAKGSDWRLLTWKGSILEGTPMEPDRVIKFDWRECRLGNDRQLDFAVECSRSVSSAKAS